MTESALKTRRQHTILELVRQETPGGQEALLRALRRRGFDVTQATLSRDLKELRLVRAPGAAGYRYVESHGRETDGPGGEPGGVRLRSVAAEEVVSVAANETAVLVRTLTGRAQGVAVVIDGLKLPDLLGTLAGDDTILVIPRSIRRTSKLKRSLDELFGI